MTMKIVVEVEVEIGKNDSVDDLIKKLDHKGVSISQKQFEYQGKLLESGISFESIGISDGCRLRVLEKSQEVQEDDLNDDVVPKELVAKELYEIDIVDHRSKCSFKVTSEEFLEYPFQKGRDEGFVTVGISTIIGNTYSMDVCLKTTKISDLKTRIAFAVGAPKECHEEFWRSYRLVYGGLSLEGKDEYELIGCGIKDLSMINMTNRRSC